MVWKGLIAQQCKSRMTWLYFFLGGFALIGILFLVYSIRLKRKLKPIKIAYERLSTEDKQRVFDLISIHTEKPQTGAFLVPVATLDDSALIVTIPEKLDNKWKGKSFNIIFKQEINNADIEIMIISYEHEFSVLGKTKFVPVLVPKVMTKTGKERNTWSAKNLLIRNRELRAVVKSFIKEREVDLLIKRNEIYI